MAETSSNPQKPRTARWVKIALGLSLALNFAIIGLGAGFLYRLSSGAPPHQQAGGRPGFVLLAALERDARRTILGDIRRDARQSRQLGRNQMQEVLMLLRQETLDRAAIAERLQSQQSRAASLQLRLSDRWLTHVEQMSLRERLDYADRLEARLRQKPKKHR